MLDEKANGCIMADEMGLGKTVSASDGTPTSLLCVVSGLFPAVTIHTQC